MTELSTTSPATVHTKIVPIIKEYFGSRPPEYRVKKPDGEPVSALVDLAGEMKALTGAEKYELACGAAKNMGYTPEQIAMIEKS